MDDVAACKGTMKFVKTARAAVRRMAYTGFSERDEVDVAFVGVARPSGLVLPKPFTVTASSQLASLVVVGSLNVVSNLKNPANSFATSYPPSSRLGPYHH